MAAKKRHTPTGGGTTGTGGLEGQAARKAAGVRDAATVRDLVTAFHTDSIIISYIKAFGDYDRVEKAFVLDFEGGVSANGKAVLTGAKVNVEDGVWDEPRALRDDLLFGLCSKLWFKDKGGLWLPSHAAPADAKEVIVRQFIGRAARWVAGIRKITL